MNGHQYGPHRPEDQPTTVEVGSEEPWGEPVEKPIAPAILQQREQVNRIAHEQVLKGTGR